MFSNQKKVLWGVLTTALDAHFEKVSESRITEKNNIVGTYVASNFQYESRKEYSGETNNLILSISQVSVEHFINIITLIKLLEQYHS